MSCVNFASIGTSWITEDFIKAASKVEGLKYVGAYSRSDVKAKDFTSENGGSTHFISLEEMAKSKLIDAVYIASPNVCHVEQSLLFLKNKKHVICEKPMAVTPQDAEMLFEVAEKNGVIFMEAIMSLHVPQFEKLKSAIKQIGNLSQVKLDFCKFSARYEKLLQGELPNIFNPEMRTGAIQDIGIYCVYPAIALFGDDCKISSNAILYKNGIDLCGTSLFTYKNMQVMLTYSKIGSGMGVSEFIGDNGTITVEKLSYLDGITLYNKNGDSEIIHKNDETVLPMQAEAKQFYEFVTNFDNNKEKYDFSKKCSIQVSKTLKEMRKISGVCF